MHNRPRSLSPLSTSVIDEPWLALVRPAISPRRVASRRVAVTLVVLTFLRFYVFPVGREERGQHGERTSRRTVRNAPIPKRRTASEGQKLGSERTALNSFYPRATRRSAGGRCVRRCFLFERYYAPERER